MNYCFLTCGPFLTTYSKTSKHKSFFSNSMEKSESYLGYFLFHFILKKLCSMYFDLKSYIYGLFHEKTPQQSNFSNQNLSINEITIIILCQCNFGKRYVVLGCYFMSGKISLNVLKRTMTILRCCYF